MNYKSIYKNGYPEPTGKVFYMLLDVIEGMPVRQVAEKYSVTTDTVYRNRKNYFTWYQHMHERIENAFAATIVQHRIIQLGQTGKFESK